MDKTKKIIPLYKWLKDNNLKQYEFADAIGMSLVITSEILRGIGHPNFTTILKILEATNYEISPNDIFHFEKRKKEFLESKNK